MEFPGDGTDWCSGVLGMMDHGSVSMLSLGACWKSDLLTVGKCFLFVKNHLRSCSSLSEHSVIQVCIESSFWKDRAVRSQADEREVGKEDRAPRASQGELPRQRASVRSHTCVDYVGAAREWQEHLRGARRLAGKLLPSPDRASAPERFG